MGDAYIVTGANRGIGFEIVASLLEHLRGKAGTMDAGTSTGSCVIYMVCRDEAKGIEARQQLLGSNTNEDGAVRVEVVQGDLSTMNECKVLGEKLVKLTENLNIAALILNAGVWPTELQMTSDGFELSFAVNVLAMYILVMQLQPNLQRSREPRIIVVSAGLYILGGSLSLEKTPYGKDFSSLKTYARTKNAACYLVQKFGQVFADTNIKINAVHPGVVNTNLGDPGGCCLGGLLSLVKRCWKPPSFAGDVILHHVLSDEFRAHNGQFFFEKEFIQKHSWHKAASNSQLMEDMYQFVATTTNMHLT